MKVILVLVLCVAAVQLKKVDPPPEGVPIDVWVPVAKADGSELDPDTINEITQQNEASSNKRAALARQNNFAGGTFIINGEQSENGSHPCLCSLQVRSGDFWYFICGACVHNENTVLTAAHCVDGFPASSLRVVCGDYDLLTVEEFEQARAIASYTKHPRYRDNSRRGFPNDIALMQVAQPLVLNDRVNTLPLATSGSNLGSSCTLVGWGVTENGGIATITREVDIPLISNSACENIWGRRAIRNSHMCFLDRSTDASACNGDSGGPAVCNGFLAGLTSWGHVDCDGFFPSVYTRLSSYNNFIVRNAF